MFSSIPYSSHSTPSASAIKSNATPPPKSKPKIAVLQLSPPPNVFTDAIVRKLETNGFSKQQIIRVAYSRYDIQSGTLDGVTLKAWLKKENICGYVGGGNKYDIPPEVYGGKEEGNIAHPPIGDKRFEFEGAWFDALSQSRIPSLLICGSLQRFAIACGYTMNQNLPKKTTTRHNPLGACSTATTCLSGDLLLKKVAEHQHPVATARGSLIRHLQGPSWQLSSFHTHSVSTERNPVYQERFGRAPINLPLYVTGVENEGGHIVNEVFEAPLHRQFVLGIQGHPEAMPHENVFHAFSCAVKQYEKEKSEKHKIHNSFAISDVSLRVKGFETHIARLEAGRSVSETKPSNRTWIKHIERHRHQTLRRLCETTSTMPSVATNSSSPSAKTIASRVYLP